MGVKLVSASGGSVEINPPATASNFVATMPAGTGTVAVNGVSGTLVSGTAVASTSGTSIDFTGIPSWVKRVTIIFNGVSLSSTSSLLIQLGTSGGVDTSSYVSTSVIARDGTTSTGLTSGAAGAVLEGVGGGFITSSMGLSTGMVEGVVVVLVSVASPVSFCSFFLATRPRPNA